MPKVVKEKIVHSDGTVANIGERYYLFCPGCYQDSQQRHPDEERYWINSALHCFNAAIHTFNGDLQKPTLSPSLLCRGATLVCHSYVKDGMIQYLGDCTHPLANQTVDLMDVPPQFAEDQQ